eukprot:g1256.t1
MNDPRRWIPVDECTSAYGFVTIEEIKGRIKQGNETSEAVLAYLRQQNKAEEAYAKALRKSVGCEDAKKGVGSWFWGGKKQDSKKRASLANETPSIGPKAWEGLNGTLSVIANQTRFEAENRIDLARNVMAELHNAVAKKHAAAKATQNALLERHDLFLRRYDQATYDVTRAKAKCRSRVEAETSERQQYDRMLEQMDSFTESLKARFNDMTEAEQEKAAVDQVKLSRELAKQKARWMQGCKSVDGIVENVSALQTRRMNTRLELEQVVKEIEKRVSEMDLERIYMLKVTMQSLVENESKCHSKRISRLQRVSELLRSVSPSTDLRLATHNNSMRRKIESACDSSTWVSVPSSAASTSSTEETRDTASPKLGGRRRILPVEGGRRSHKGPRLPSRLAHGIVEEKTRGTASSSSAATTTSHDRQEHIESASDTASAKIIERFVAFVSTEDEDGAATARSDEDANGENVSRVVDLLFESKTNRDRYIRELNRQRSSNKSIGVGQKFEALTKTMRGFLDACVKHRDVGAATMLMIMSQTFFKTTTTTKAPLDTTKSHTSDTGKVDAPRSDPPVPTTHQKEFVERTISSHPLFKDILFWESAFLHIVSEEVERNHESFLTRSASSSTGDKKAMLKTAEYHYKQIVFGQLGSISISMRSFGMSLGATKAFIQKMCVAHGLNDEEMESLVGITRAQEVVRRHSSVGLGALTSFNEDDVDVDEGEVDKKLLEATAVDEGRVVAIGASGSRHFSVDL